MTEWKFLICISMNFMHISLTVLRIQPLWAHNHRQGKHFASVFLTLLMFIWHLELAFVWDDFSGQGQRWYSLFILFPEQKQGPWDWNQVLIIRINTQYSLLLRTDGTPSIPMGLSKLLQVFLENFKLQLGIGLTFLVLAYTDSKIIYLNGINRILCFIICKNILLPPSTQ